MTPSARPGFPYLLGALALSGFEGSVTLAGEGMERSVILRGGYPVNVLSASQEETLGRVLLEVGKITADDYAELLDRMVKTRRSAGELLVSMGMFKAEEMVMALEYQVRRKLINCFKPGRFKARIAPRTVPPGLVIVKLDPIGILFEGLTRTFRPDRLRTEFPLEDETVLAGWEIQGKRAPVIGEVATRVHRAIGARSKLAALKRAVGDVENLHAILYGLHALHMVDAVGFARPSFPGLKLPGRWPLSPGAPPPLPTSRPEPPGPGKTRFPSGATVSEQVFPTVSPKLAEKVLTIAGDDHFAVLDLPHEVSDEQVKDAFYQLMDTFKLHNVRATYQSEKDMELAEHLFNRATLAYQVLSEEQRRNAYLEDLAFDRSRKRRMDPRILADAEALKGELALGAGRYEEAIQHLWEAIEKYEMDPGYFHKLGLAGYLKALEETPPDDPIPDELAKPFERALALDPNYDPARYYLGNIAKRNGNLGIAKTEFVATLRTNPRNRQAQAALKEVQQRLKEQEES